MARARLAFLSAALFLLGLSCSKSETVTNEYFSGQVAEKYRVVENKDGDLVKHGKYQSFYPDGQRECVVWFNKGVPSGKGTGWYENGKRMFEIAGTRIEFFDRRGNTIYDGDIGRQEGDFSPGALAKEILEFGRPLDSRPQGAQNVVAITADSAAVHEYLGTESPVLGTVRKGQTLEFVFEGTSWFQIKMGDEVGGVEKSKCKVVH